MELNVKTCAIGGISLLIIGGLCGRFATPSKVVTKIEEKIVTKEVIRYKEVKSKDEDRNKETIITETILPDGTRKIEKRIVDKSEITTHSNVEASKDSTSETTKKTETTVSNQKNDWNVAIMGGVSRSNPVDVKYGAHVQHRFLGPFSLGVYGNGFGGISDSNQFYGISLGGSY